MQMGLKDSVDQFYKGLEEGYYSFCDYLQKDLKFPIYDVFVNPIEGKGIPSFPVAILLFLLLIAAGAFAFVSLQPMTLRVLVISDDGAVEGATVLLEAGEYSKLLTTENGLARFEKPPKGKEATLTVSLEGFPDARRSFRIGDSPEITIRLRRPELFDAEIIVSDFSGLPLRGALVEYSYEAEGGSASTDADGKVVIPVPENKELTVSVTLAGYQTSSGVTYTPEAGKPRRITLNKAASPIPTPASLEFSQLQITIKDEATNAGIDAVLTILDSVTEDELKVVETEFGSYENDDEFRVGMRLKVIARAEGYEPKASEKTLRETTAWPISLKKIGATSGLQNGTVTIRVQDERNASLQSQIWLWEHSDEGNYSAVKKEAASSVLTFPISSLTWYYATAFKDGYLPGRTLAFAGSQEKKITLYKAYANNSANLTLNTINEDGVKMRTVPLAFFDELGDQIPPYEQRTDNNGKAVVRNLAKYSSYTIFASKDQFSGSETVDLSLNLEANITMYAPKGRLIFSATDLDTNGSISQLDAFVYYDNEKNNALYGSCSSLTGSCAIEARSDKTFKWVINSRNYQNASGKRKASPNADLPVNAQMARLDSRTIIKATLDRITDLNGNAKARLVSGQEYLVSFDLYSKPGAASRGLFVQLSGGDGSEIAYFTNYSHDGFAPVIVKGSSSLSDLEECEAPFISSEDDFVGLSWLNAEYSYEGSSKVVMRFKVVPNIIAEELVINYRGFAVSNGEYIRDPIDSELGFSYEIPGKPWCFARTRNVTYDVLACGNFGETCCSQSEIGQEGSSPCVENLKCSVTSAIPRGICTYPTSCGSAGTFCTGFDLCCNEGSGKGCVPPSECYGGVAECTPECISYGGNMFCDSSGSLAICRDIEDICGMEGESCCTGAANKCDDGLTCSSENACIPCGGLSDSCCEYSRQHPDDACNEGLWCAPEGICSQKQLCGAAQNECTGATVCCYDAGKEGQCVYVDDCTLKAQCLDCRFDQGCDTTNLNNPQCRDCISDFALCEFGGLGELCTIADDTYACENGACIEQQGSDLGLCKSCGDEDEYCCQDDENKCLPGLMCSNGACTPCGEEGEMCCDSDPQCTQQNTMCNQQENICKFGNRDCNNEMCVELNFKQLQCPRGLIDPDLADLCDEEESGNGFNAHSLKDCGNSCVEGELEISYDITEVANKLPGTLRIELYNQDASSDILGNDLLVPVTALVGNQVFSLADSDSFTLQITDSSKLQGRITLTPKEHGTAIIKASYSHSSTAPAVVIKPYVVIASNMPASPPIQLPNPFSCNALTLMKKTYSGAGQPVIESSCDRIVFRVDSFFPADAIPLNDSGLGGCNLGYAFGTASEPRKYNDCFVTGATPGGNALRFWPGKKDTCPLKPIGNMVPSADNIQMRVNCTGTAGRIINITIANYSDIGDLNALEFSGINYKTPYLKDSALPLSFYGDDYDTEASSMKLVYALNNRVKGITNNEEYWAAEYSPSAGYFKRSTTSTKLIGSGQDASLVSWDDSRKEKIFVHPDAGAVANQRPPVVATIASSSPAGTGLASYLNSKAFQRIGHSNVTALAYAPAVLESFKEIAGNILRKTAFKRSFDATFYCIKPPEDISNEDTYDPEICRDSAAAWMRVTNKQRIEVAACTFCHDTYEETYGAPSEDNYNVDVCDIRCLPSDECETGHCAYVEGNETYIGPDGTAYACDDSGVPEDSDEGIQCLYSCSEKSIAEGDYCGTPEECDCSPEGLRTTLIDEGYEYVWENGDAELYEVTMGAGIGGLESRSPYKYFVQNAESAPITFSAVFPLSADIVYNKFNRYPEFSSARENLVEIAQLPDDCKYRQGIYLLSVQTTNGEDFFFGERNFGLSPLAISDNYPDSMGAGTQDFCGNVVACNLFDPYGLHSRFPGKIPADMYPEDEYLERCLTNEYPVVPDGDARYDKNAVASAIWDRSCSPLSCASGKAKDQFVANFPNAFDLRSYSFIGWQNHVPATNQFAFATKQGEEGDYPALLSKFFARGKCGFLGTGTRKRRSIFLIFEPYDLANYPLVFGDVEVESCRACGFGDCSVSAYGISVCRNGDAC